MRERIQINNEPLSEELFAKYFFEIWDRLEESARRAGLPTDTSAKPVYFRFLTLMAFHTFASEGVKPAIVECGIGGEYDSTNILVSTPVAGITSLGIDHTALLGNTIESIAWHKAGIMKPGTRVFTAPQPEGALGVLRRRATEKKSSLTVVAERNPEIQLERVMLGLAADFQKDNASLAVAVASAFLGYSEEPRSEKVDLSQQWTGPLLPQFRRGLEDAKWGGRCEIRKERNISWYIDGGHTLESIRLSGNWFASEIRSKRVSQSLRGKRVLIFNQQTRDASALAEALHTTLVGALEEGKPFSHAVFCTNVTFKDAGYRPDLMSINTNAADVEALSVQKKLAETWAGIDASTQVTVKATIEEAVQFVRAVAQNEETDSTVMALVTGSLHLVGGFLEVIETAASNS